MGEGGKSEVKMSKSDGNETKGWAREGWEIVKRNESARGHFPSHYIRYYSLYPFGKNVQKNEGDKK